MRNLIIIMESVGNKPSEWTYVRKPLNFVVPLLGDMQARKNPFARQHKTETMQVASRANLLSPVETEECTKKHAKTMIHATAGTRGHLSMVQVPKPSQEPADLDSSALRDCLRWTSESSAELEESSVAAEYEEFKQDSTPSASPSDSCRAILSHEVQHNFFMLRKIPMAVPEEIALKAINLDYDSRAGRSSNKTLILDLDDTLIHTINPSFNYNSINITHTEFKTVLYKDAELPSIFSIRVVVRPYAIQLLEELSKIYEIIVLSWY